MDVALNYKVNLPQSISEILNSDFWILNNVPASIASYSSEPMRFSAETYILLKRGSCVVDINLRHYELTAPCYLHLNANSYIHIHSVSSDLEAGVIVISTEFSDSISLFFRGRGGNPSSDSHVMILDERMMAEFTRLFNNLTILYNDISNPDRFQAIIYAIVSFFFANSTRLKREDHSVSMPSPARRLTETFLSLVQRYFSEEHTLAFYAGKLEVSEKHLYRTVKKITGFTASQWIDRYLLLEAKVMLKSSSLNISQISDSLHFASPSAFGKFFRRSTGMSPKQFRKTN